ncbi:Uncharacterized oxidoreductase YjmC [Galdieria sulphuraria]|nr:Uncharacterized oxidoreductase YjmC [Galdieria sulphuraria]
MPVSQVAVPLDELEELIEKRLEKLKYNEQEIQVIKQVILYSQLVDGTQGVLKLLMDGVGSITQPNPSQYAPRVVYDGGVALRIDGGSSLGMVVLDFATNKAIERATELGLAMVGVFHSCSSTGALGYYVEKIASKGLVGIVSSGSTPTVAAFGSAEKNFGTNPLAYAIPGSQEPCVVYDASTSAMSFWGVKMYEMENRPLPENVALDSHGRTTTDASLVHVLKTFGGAKGSGISLLLEFLNGALVGSTSARGDTSNWGSFILAFQPDIFHMGKEQVEKNIIELVDRIHACRPCEEKLF